MVWFAAGQCVIDISGNDSLSSIDNSKGYRASLVSIPVVFLHTVLDKHHLLYIPCHVYPML